jgi:anti-sigma factor RsiW
MSARPSDITCKELVELVTGYFEGALPAAERERFEAHIADCDACRAYVEQMRGTIEGAGRIDEETLDPSARDALLETFRDWKRGRAT